MHAVLEIQYSNYIHATCFLCLRLDQVACPATPSVSLCAVAQSLRTTRCRDLCVADVDSAMTTSTPRPFHSIWRSPRFASGMGSSLHTRRWPDFEVRCEVQGVLLAIVA